MASERRQRSFLPLLMSHFEWVNYYDYVHTATQSKKPHTIPKGVEQCTHKVNLVQLINEWIAPWNIFSLFVSFCLVCFRLFMRYEWQNGFFDMTFLAISSWSHEVWGFMNEPLSWRCFAVIGVDEKKNV